MSPEQMAERARAVRLEDKVIAAAAGIGENTVFRTFAGKTRPLLLTAKAIEAAIVTEELRLRDYLIGLHGVPAAKNSSDAGLISDRAEGGAA